MRNKNFICIILSLFTLFIVSCSSTQKEENTQRLYVTEFSEKRILLADEAGEKPSYEISNSKFEIKDSNNNTLTWDELKLANIIEVHYSGGISEIAPATFNNISKLVIIS